MGGGGGGGGDDGTLNGIIAGPNGGEGSMCGPLGMAARRKNPGFVITVCARIVWLITLRDKICGTSEDTSTSVDQAFHGFALSEDDIYAPVRRNYRPRQ